MQRISRAIVPCDTVELARYLLGKVLVREHEGHIASGRIVETEAYLPQDPACHAFRGMTQRNRSLFLEPGHAYVYLCYGTSQMLNVSSEAGGIGAGVLLRALQPLDGIERMLENSGQKRVGDIARGPGRLTAALRVDRRHDGLNLFDAKQLWIGSDGHRIGCIHESVRIGISKAAELKLRYFAGESCYLSGPRKLNQPSNCGDGKCVEA